MQAAPDRPPTAALALADGTIFPGEGFGAIGERQGELVFNTAMTGYQEIMSDPSYAGQIITFTFPHIGNVGTNGLDIEATTPVARGMVTRTLPTAPSSWRADTTLSGWLEQHGIVAIGGIDTRRLTAHLRDHGAQNAALIHAPDGAIDHERLLASARAFPGIDGTDLVPDVTCGQRHDWREAGWNGDRGYVDGGGPNGSGPNGSGANESCDGPHVAVIDYGVKHNILRSLALEGCRITVLPATITASEVLALEPDAVLLSNGPGDPAATGAYAVPQIQGLVRCGKARLRHLPWAPDARHRAWGAGRQRWILAITGANHPVQDLTTGQGWRSPARTTALPSLMRICPETIEVTHRSLFDGTIQGIRLKDRPVFSVQYHPEASPGPADSHYLFRRFLDLIRQG